MFPELTQLGSYSWTSDKEGLLLFNSDLVTLAIHRTRLGAQRGCARRSSPALLAVALQRRGITPTVAAAGSGAQREGVSRIEAQEVVIGITEEMKQHLEKKNVNNTHFYAVFALFFFLDAFKVFS